MVQNAHLETGREPNPVDIRALDGLALLHDLVPFLPVDRLHAILNNQDLPPTSEGTALFADISGFTGLAERLGDELGPERGAEELNSQVNYTFVGLIDAVDRYHGSVLRFSGDGFTAWFTDENSAIHAATASLAMQAVMQAVTAALPDLRLKIGLGTGTARRFLPGDPAMGIFDVLAGPAVTRMTQAEKMAEPGQIVICAETSAVLGGQLKVERLNDDFYRLMPTIFAPAPTGATRWPSIRWMDHVDNAWALVEACRPYLSAPIYERLQGGHGTYVGELRTVSPLFVGFTGIDYDAPDAAGKLDELVRAAQEIIDHQGGYLNEVGVDDKGNVLVALFGTPVALENPARRAVYAAQALAAELPHVDSVQCGLTCETLFSATVGSPMRRAYAAIGDGVNLAARLMSHTAPGEILANYRAHQLADDFAWVALPSIRVKGKAAPVRLYRLRGLAEDTQPLWPAGRFVARIKELKALNWALDASKTGQEHILLMSGEPGLGKSHLLRKFTTLMSERGVTGLVGAGSNIEQQISYFCWRAIFSAYFDLDVAKKKPDQATMQRQVQSYITHIAPQMVNHIPLLNDVLSLGFAENDFTETLDPAQRHTVLTSLLVALLRAWLEEDALAIVLDNAQWLDALSWDVLYHLAQQLGDQPLTILVAMRPVKRTSPARLDALAALSATRELRLEPLGAADVEALAAAELGAATLPDGITDLVMQKTGGNPFFIREIVAVLLDNHIVAVQDGKASLQGDPASLQIPDTVQGVVRSRIDHLSPDQQVLVKVAAVIGQQFHYHTLRNVQPLDLGDEALLANLNALDTVDVARQEDSDDNDPVYAFRYAITREVAYGALSFRQRRHIHEAVARWYEHEYGDNLTPYYPILTHHWREAENRQHEQLYCYLAGKQAAAQYASDDAINYLERALEITGDDAPSMLKDMLITLEELYHLRGLRSRQQTLLSTLTMLAEEQDDDHWRTQSGILWARCHESQAAYMASIESARCAFEAAQRLNDHEAMGLSNVYWGLGLMHLGSYAEAIKRLSTVHATNDEIEARRLNTLGITLAATGRYEEAGQAFQQALTKARASADRTAVGQTLNNMGNNFKAMGDYGEATRNLSQALVLRRTIGDRHGEAQTLTDLGDLSLITGDYELALDYLQQALATFRQVDDRSGEATVLNYIGKLAYERGDFELARIHLQDSLDQRQAIDDRAGTCFSLLDLALVETALDSLHAARDHVDQALESSQTLDLTLQSRVQYIGHGLAGLIMYRLGDIVDAQARVDLILAIIAERGFSQQPIYPLKIALFCTEVLEACNRHQEALGLLTEAHDLLRARADHIVDPEQRARYLLNVADHRTIIARYKAANPAPGTRRQPHKQRAADGPAAANT